MPRTQTPSGYVGVRVAVLAAILASAFPAGCVTSSTSTYRPPGKSNDLRIEIVTRAGMAFTFELKIDGAHVAEIHWPIGADHASAHGSFAGRRVEMKGQFHPGMGYAGYTIDVFLDGARAGNFVF